MDYWTAYTMREGLISDLIYSSVVDREGGLWFGGKNPDGAARYDGRSWEQFSARNSGLGPGHIWDIALDARGEIWFGTAGGGLACYDGTSWRRYTMEDGLAGNHVYALATDREGRVWCGCAPPPDEVIQEGGVSIFDGKHFESYTSDSTQGVDVGGGNSGLCDNRVYAICIEESGRAWLGTKGGGICCYDGRDWQTYGINEGLPCDEVGDGAATIDQAGNVWFGTRGGGACCFDGQRWTVLNMTDGLAGDYVYAIKTGPDGNLWFGCAPDPEVTNREGGVSIYDGTAFRNFTSDFSGGKRVGGGNSPLIDNRVYTILFDREGNGWFGTKGGGISCLSHRGIPGSLRKNRGSSTGDR